MFRSCIVLLTFALSCLVLSPPIRAEDWPSFRGPGNNGISNDRGFPTEWSKTKNVRWRVSMPGPGNSSPIVVGERVFVTCADKDGHERSLYCFNRTDGREIWKRSVAFDSTESTHKTNPFCPSTPVSDGQAIYVWHGSAGMHAYSMDGMPLWSQDMGTFRHIWGLGASPIIVGDHVVQLCGPGERTFVAAFDRRTGKIVWQTPNETGGSESSKGRYVGTWATPFIVKLDGQEQLVCCFHSRVVGLAPNDGKELWSVDGLSSDRSDVCYAMPMLADRNMVVMGGYGGPEFGIRFTELGEAKGPDRLWRNEKKDQKAYHPQRIGSGVTLGAFLFMANADEAGSIECIDSSNGKRKWVESRTSDGPHWGSAVMADGKLFIPGQKGITRVIQANLEKYEMIAENDLEEHCNATPAFSNGEIFIRTYESLFAIAETR